MENLFNRMTVNYRGQGFYVQRKSHYTLIFILVMSIYAVVNSVIEYALDSKIVFFFTALGCVAIFLLIMMPLFYKGHLVLCQYIFMLVGTGIGVQYMAYSTHFQFYTQMIIVLIIGVTIHIHKTQMILIYTLVNALVLFRAYYLYTFITQGYVEKAMLNQSLQAALGIVVFSVIIAYFNTVLGKEIRETKELGEISVTDTLTHLANRAGFDQSVSKLFQEKQAYGIAILDIDRFKLINDKQGHQAGDRVLITLANLMRDYFDQPYQIFRWGGEEFVVIGTQVASDEMLKTLEEFRERVAAYDFGLGYSMTISGGFIMADSKNDPEKDMIDADNALYDAKRSGRNRIVSAYGGHVYE